MFTDRRLRWFAPLGLLLIGGGCVIAGSKESFMDHGLPKAVFDMECPAEKLEVTDLGSSSMGVRGCDKQARYQWVHGAGWVLNSANDKK